MRLSPDKTTLLHDIIAKTYARPFDEAVALDVASSVCSLVDAQYFSVMFFPRGDRTRLMYISNNPPDFIPVYQSVSRYDFLMESLVSTAGECVLSRMSDIDRPTDRSFIRTVQSSRPISDVAYAPLEIGGSLLGCFAVAKAGLAKPAYTDDELDTFRLIAAFLNDALERSLLPPPVEDDLAFLDCDGRVVAAGASIAEALRDLFGGGRLSGKDSLGEARRLRFQDRCRLFLHGGFEVGMERIGFIEKGRSYEFAFGLLGSIAHKVGREGIPCVSVRLLSARDGRRDAPSPAKGGEAGRLRFTAREREVILGIYGGKSNKEIALDLGIDESTIKRHTHNIYEKTGFRSRVELVLGLKDF